MGINQSSERSHTQAGDGLWMARSVSLFMLGVVVGTTWQDGMTMMMAVLVVGVVWGLGWLSAEPLRLPALGQLRVERTDLP